MFGGCFWCSNRALGGGGRWLVSLGNVHSLVNCVTRKGNIISCRLDIKLALHCTGIENLSRYREAWKQ
jgi:hypothetical protein